MTHITEPPATVRVTDAKLAGAPAGLIPIVPLGMALGLFFVISYLGCVLLYLILPGAVLNHAVLALFLPGFELLSWSSFFLGLVESFGYGWYIALVFGPLYNFFVSRRWW